MSSINLLGWWRGQGSNLRSPSRRQIYSLLRLTTPAPLPVHNTKTQKKYSGNSPRGDSNPLTYRLQVGCATIALLGHYSDRNSKKCQLDAIISNQS